MKHFLNMSLRILLTVGAVAFLNACGSEEPSYLCTANMEQSIRLSATDANNSAIDEFEVTYQINGGAIMSFVCNATQSCLPEYGASGNFAITVSKAGYLPASLNVTITKNLCHVNGQTIVVKLKPLV